jgi:anti-sigma regulatory factor (Ser/Thr protein kinase)
VNAATCEPFAHAALLYRDQAEYLAGTMPFIRAGLAAGQPVALAVPRRNLRWLREVLSADADRLVLHDVAVAGRNPGRIIPTVLSEFADANAGRPVRIVVESIWAGRSALEYPACAQSEALVNVALADQPVAILCPYDSAALDRSWIQDAHRTHPALCSGTRRWRSTRYGDPVAVARRFNWPLPSPPDDAATFSVDLHTLPAARRFVAGHATAASLAPPRVTELILAVNELAANAVEHGGGIGHLAVWAQHDHLICQISDDGHLIDPLAGRRPSRWANAGGRGLLLVNQLCDLVRTYTTASGTITRIHVRR